MKTAVRFFQIALLALLAAGCATIDYEYPRQESFFLPETSNTHFGKLVEPQVLKHPPDQSGFYPMNDGVDALTARLLLAQRAEKSIDVQYYLIKNDIVGRVFIHMLLQAAHAMAASGAPSRTASIRSASSRWSQASGSGETIGSYFTTSTLRGP